MMVCEETLAYLNYLNFTLEFLKHVEGDVYYTLDIKQPKKKGQMIGKSKYLEEN